MPSKSELLRYQMQQRDGAYEEYFRRLIEAGADATGDITPEYAGLEARDLARSRRWRKCSPPERSISVFMRRC